MVNTLSGSQGKCFMKIIVDHESDRVVGMHMIGPACAEIMQVRPTPICLWLPWSILTWQHC